MLDSPDFLQTTDHISEPKKTPRQNYVALNETFKQELCCKELH